MNLTSRPKQYWHLVLSWQMNFFKLHEQNIWFFKVLKNKNLSYFRWRMYYKLSARELEILERHREAILDNFIQHQKSGKETHHKPPVLVTFKILSFLMISSWLRNWLFYFYGAVCGLTNARKDLKQSLNHCFTGYWELLKIETWDL